VRVKFGTLSVPMWHELQFMPVCRAKLGMARLSVGAVIAMAPAISEALARRRFHHERMLFPSPGLFIT
jgi:hypothetical protein